MGLIDIIEYKIMEFIDLNYYTREEQDKDLEEYFNSRINYDNGRLRIR